jgi:molybdate transport system substrate-binding protein
MKFHRAIAAVAALSLPLFAGMAQAAELKVFSTTALKTVLEELGPQFEKSTGNKLVYTIGPAASLKTQIEQGAAFDVAILTVAATDDLAKQGKITPDTRAAIAHAGIGVAVRKGAPKPDISTVDAFKRALLNAKSVGFTAAGASGAYLKGLFEKLGIAEALQPKLKLLPGPAGAATANGEVEIGMTQISEILPYAGAELVGPFPAEIQLTTSFGGAVATNAAQPEAAGALLKFMKGPEAAAVIKAKGLDPAG